MGTRIRYVELNDDIGWCYIIVDRGFPIVFQSKYMPCSWNSPDEARHEVIVKYNNWNRCDPTRSRAEYEQLIREEGD
jgi:hypothetical protein